MKKNFNVAIIGAGWFGCHIASEILNNLKNFSVTVFEKNKNIFQGASGYNQNRLHLGFHYPRSIITRRQSKEGFYKFIKKYPSFSEKIKKNLYAVETSEKSKVNFNKFIKIMNSSGLKYKLADQDKKNYELKKIDNLINCDEKLILVDKAKIFFKKKLKKNLVLNYEVKQILKKNGRFKINNYQTEFDFIINCTWQKFNLIKKWKLIYELCMCVIYERKKKVLHPEFSLTIMDGPFYTLYKWKKKLYNLYSVKYSRIKKYKSYKKTLSVLKVMKMSEKLRVRSKIEKNFLRYYPDFFSNYKFKKFITTIRTIKTNNLNDDRNFELKMKNNKIDVLSGKIDHICLTSEKIIKWLKKKKY